MQTPASPFLSNTEAESMLSRGVLTLSYQQDPKSRRYYDNHPVEATRSSSDANNPYNSQQDATIKYIWAQIDLQICTPCKLHI
jgi:hypothetical protein